nr:hypothetical protein [uncultured Lichenicoccus sp.]
MSVFAGATKTAAQRNQIHAIGRAWKADMVGLQVRLDALRAQENDLLLTPGTIAPARAEALARQEAGLLEVMQAERIHNEIALRSFLSDSQLSQAASTIVVYARARRGNRPSLRGRKVGRPACSTHARSTRPA